MKTHEQVQAHAKERGWELMDTNLKLEIGGSVFWKDFLIAYTVGAYAESVIIEGCWIQNVNYYNPFPSSDGMFLVALKTLVSETLEMGDKEGVDPDEAEEADRQNRKRELRAEQ